MIWQDWITIFSAVVGFISFIITVITLILAGSIKKAVEKKENEVKSADKLKGSTDRFLSTINSIDFKEIVLDDYRKVLSVVGEVMLCRHALTGVEIETLENIEKFCTPIYRENAINEENKREFILYIDKIKLILTRRDVK